MLHFHYIARVNYTYSLPLLICRTKNWFNLKEMFCVTAVFGDRPPHCWSLEITLRHITLGRTLLDEWSACHRNLCLTTHKSKSMPPVGFESTNLASEEPQTHILDFAATCIGKSRNYVVYFNIILHTTAPFWRDFRVHFELRFRTHKFNHFVLSFTDTNTVFVRCYELNIHIVPYSDK